jgi:short-subunit dehydrogenase
LTQSYEKRRIVDGLAKRIFFCAMEKPLIVITGGTKGIGRAIAELFAQQGYDIVTCARTPEDLAEMKAAFGELYQAQLHASVADVSIKAEAKAFAEFVKQLKRPIKILVNNAGEFGQGPLHKEAKGVMEQLMAANYYSAYWVSNSLIDKISHSKQGHIINICSVGSISTSPRGGSYFIAKQALYGYTKALREELRPLGISVTAILPSATYTNSWAGSGMNPDRLMKASDVAQAVWNVTQTSEWANIEEVVLRPPLGDLL